MDDFARVPGSPGCIKLSPTATSATSAPATCFAAPVTPPTAPRVAATTTATATVTTTPATHTHGAHSVGPFPAIARHPKRAKLSPPTPSTPILSMYTHRASTATAQQTPPTTSSADHTTCNTNINTNTNEITYPRSSPLANITNIANMKNKLQHTNKIHGWSCNVEEIHSTCRNKGEELGEEMEANSDTDTDEELRVKCKAARSNPATATAASNSCFACGCCNPLINRYCCNSIDLT